RGDIYQLADYAARRGLEPVVALSPTPELIRAAIQQLRRNGVKRVAIGVDDLVPPAVTINAVEWARDAGMGVELNTRVMYRNAAKLPHLLDMLEALGADTWNLYFLVPIGISAEEMPTPEQTDEIFEFIDEDARHRIKVRILEAPNYERYAGRSTQDAGLSVFISCNGDVRPGELIPIGAGNVRY